MGVRNLIPFVHKDTKFKFDQTVCRPLYLSFGLLLIIPENILKTAVLRAVKLNPQTLPKVPKSTNKGADQRSKDVTQTTT